MSQLPQLVEHSNYLEFVVPDGKHDEAYWSQFLKSMVATVEQTGKTRILVQRPAQDPSERVEGMVIYRMALRTAEAFGVSVRIAIQSPVAQEDSFFETVATNRGAMIKVDKNRAALVAWLSEDD